MKGGILDFGTLYKSVLAVLLTLDSPEFCGMETDEEGQLSAGGQIPTKRTTDLSAAGRIPGPECLTNTKPQQD